MGTPIVMRPRLLLVGDNITILYSREMVLGSRFAIHVSARNSEALKLIRDVRFDLVVILDSTPTWRRFAGFVSQQSPSPRILIVTKDQDEFPESADTVLPQTSGLYGLLKACMEMFGMVSNTKSQGYSNRSYKKPVAVS